MIYPAYLAAKADNALPPEIVVTKETPRTFIAMTQDDGVRVQCGLFYYLALTEAKVPAEMHLYPTGGHGYGLRPSQHLVSTWPQAPKPGSKALEWSQRSSFSRRSPKATGQQPSNQHFPAATLPRPFLFVPHSPPLESS